MRMIRTFSALLLACVAAYAQDAPTIQKQLEATYALTTPTADKTDIVTAGAILTLQKDNFLMTEATKADVNHNVYKDGRINHNSADAGRKVGGFLARAGVPGASNTPSVATRTFVHGEKMWVTKIEVNNGAVVMELFTDQIGDYRYHAFLTFYGAKGQALPPADQVAKAVAEVFSAQPPDTAAAAPAAPAENAAGAPVAAPPPPPPPAEKFEEIPPPPPPEKDPVTIELKMTKDQVVTALGQPVKILKPAAGKEIYVYKDIKVTFQAGKVVNIE